MASGSRLQINFERLLDVCEKQATASCESSNWRLKKFVEDLQKKLTLLNKESCNKAHPEVLKDYERRVGVLQGILLAEDQGSPGDKLKVVQTIPFFKQTSIKANILETGPASAPDVLQHAKAKFSSQSRQALLGEGDGLRQRGGVSADTTESELDSVLSHHEKQQERLAEDMVNMARNMKDHARVASRIVKEDTKRLEDTNKLADSNYSQLKIESARLEEHTKKSNCWMLLLLIFIIIVFVWTVIFMKVFHKPRI
ncbi:vesicle transport protein USE1-like [Watersipora subatra]|uniref:vesicle transport protein USE1-like n=1 Tax=Watersipora subatra TaxID=2589382 RepID=UPI00355B471C